MQMAELERIDPNAQAWADKLVRRAVGRHIFEEEGTWFLDLKTDGNDQAFPTRRFREDFERNAARVPPSSERRSFAVARSRSGEGEGKGERPTAAPAYQLLPQRGPQPAVRLT